MMTVSELPLFGFRSSSTCVSETYLIAGASRATELRTTDALKVLSYVPKLLPLTVSVAEV